MKVAVQRLEFTDEGDLAVILDPAHPATPSWWRAGQSVVLIIRDGEVSISPVDGDGNEIPHIGTVSIRARLRDAAAAGGTQNALRR